MFTKVRTVIFGMLALAAIALSVKNILKIIPHIVRWTPKTRQFFQGD